MQSPEVSAMGSLLNNLKPVVTAVLGYVGDICTTIAEQPVLLLTMGILLIGGAIGIFGRLLSRLMRGPDCVLLSQSGPLNYPVRYYLW